MKKLLLVTSVLTLISTYAFASQARLLSLGMKETDNDGMYHISDSRNMFLNSAYVNIYNNYVTAEYGQNGFNVGSAAVTLDRTTSPKAQGGFFTKQGAFVYGVYLGNESNTSSLLRAVATSAAAIANSTGARMLNSADNQIDLFIGGENGVSWGANALLATGKDDARKAKDTSIATRFGVIGSNWDAHLNLSLASKAEANESVNLAALGLGTETIVQEFKGKLGAQLGGSYVYSGNNRLFGYVKHYGWEQKDSFNQYPRTGIVGSPIAGKVIGGQTGTSKGDFTSIYLGWGSHFDVNTTDKVYTSLAAKKTSINVKFANKGEVRNLIIPLSIGYEAVAMEWLTLRGSITQNLYGQKDNKNLDGLNLGARDLIGQTFGTNGKGSIANSTEVNAGATLTFGNLAVDGLIGMTDSAGAFSTASKTGVLSLGTLLTKAAVTYKF